jgi:hypothetical protein
MKMPNDNRGSESRKFGSQIAHGLPDGMSVAAAEPQWDFFISYTQADRAWAEWIAWELEESGRRVLIQAWDFVPGSDWISGMQAGIRDAARTIAVLSDAYLESVYGNAEWQAIISGDPDRKARKLLIVRTVSCERPGLLAGIVGIDLFEIPEAEARDRLWKMIAAAESGRAKPAVPPQFPGAQRAIPSEPGFPGSDQTTGTTRTIHRSEDTGSTGRGSGSRTDSKTQASVHDAVGDAQPTSSAGRRPWKALRKRKTLFVGLVIILILTAAAGILITRITRTVMAIEVIRTVSQGQRFTPSDLHEVQIEADSGVSYVSWSYAGQVTQYFAATLVPAGTLLTAAMVASTDNPVARHS